MLPPVKVIMSSGRELDVSPGSHADTAITLLFDTLVSHDCDTRREIEVASASVSKIPFRNVPDVDEALALIRDPNVANYFGWTVPHVPRGKPRDKAKRNLPHRFMVVIVGSGTPLSIHELALVEEGTLSSMRYVRTSCERLANILRQTATVTTGRSKTFCKDQATILDGVATQAKNEAEKLETALAKVP